MQQHPLSFSSPLILLIALCAAPGCGKSDEPEPESPSFDSGVEESKLLGELSPAEGSQMCEAYAGFVGETIPAADLCASQGVGAYFESSGDAVAECQVAVDDCLATGEFDFSTMCEDFGAEPSFETECAAASVGELQDCMAASVSAMAEIYYQIGIPECGGIDAWLQELTLSDITNWTESLENFDPSGLSECAHLEEECVLAFD